MGIIGAAVIGGAGLYAYKKIKKSRKDKRAMQPHEYPQQQHDNYRDLDYGDIPEKPKDLNAKNRDFTSDSYSGDYYQNKNSKSQNYDYQYQNQYQNQYQQQQPTLMFQPASDKFRGQHFSIDQPDASYRQSQQQQPYYTNSTSQNNFFNTSRDPYVARSSPAPRYQSGFVEEIDNESVRR